MEEAITPKEAAKLNEEAQNQRDMLIKQINNQLKLDWPDASYSGQQVVHDYYSNSSLLDGVVSSICSEYESKNWDIKYSREKDPDDEKLWIHKFRLWVSKTADD